MCAVFDDLVASVLHVFPPQDQERLRCITDLGHDFRWLYSGLQILRDGLACDSLLPALLQTTWTPGAECSDAVPVFVVAARRLGLPGTVILAVLRRTTVRDMALTPYECDIVASLVF